MVVQLKLWARQIQSEDFLGSEGQQHVHALGKGRGYKDPCDETERREVVFPSSGGKIQTLPLGLKALHAYRLSHSSDCCQSWHWPSTPFPVLRPEPSRHLLNTPSPFLPWDFADPCLPHSSPITSWEALCHPTGLSSNATSSESPLPPSPDLLSSD